MENVRKYTDIKLVTTKARRNYLVPEPNYSFSKKFIGHRKEQNARKKRKSKIMLHGYRQLYSLGRFIVYIKTEDIAKDFEARFDT